MALVLTAMALNLMALVPVPVLHMALDGPKVEATKQLAGRGGEKTEWPLSRTRDPRGGAGPGCFSCVCLFVSWAGVSVFLCVWVPAV